MSDDDKSAQSWAIIATALASFYVHKNPKDALQSNSHPALHHRIGHFIQSLNFKDDRYRYYFSLLCWLVLHDIFPNILTQDRTFEDPEDALNDALDKLDISITNPT